MAYVQNLSHVIVRADLHGTIFASCDKLTTWLTIGVYVRKMHVLKRCGNRKSCRRRALSLSHGTKIVMCKSALTAPVYWP